MATLYNQLLLDPTAAELLAALSGDWPGLPPRVVAEAEGVAALGKLRAAWWSDYQGRKHVRIGVRAGGGSPLACVYPERVYLVRGGGRLPVWLVSCGCGATGLTEEVAWMGDCCGPCHDRREEGAELSSEVPHFEMPRLVGALAYSPDGKRLALSAGEVTLLDLATGNVTTLKHPDSEMEEEDCYSPLAFSPDGRRLATGKPSASLTLWDVVGEGRPIEFDGCWTEWGILDLAFSPDGRYLACVRDDGAVNMVRLDNDLLPNNGALSTQAFSVTFSPDSQTLAVGLAGDSVALRSPESCLDRERIVLQPGSDDQVWFVRYIRDGDDLILLSNGARHHGWTLRRWSLRHNQQTNQASLPPAAAFAMSPDGRYLARLVAEVAGPNPAVAFWDLLEWRDAGSLEWPSSGRMGCLAFSPDGETLATGCESGVVKLWPWRMLLEGRR